MSAVEEVTKGDSESVEGKTFEAASMVSDGGLLRGMPVL
jgi:hypothetical protein